MANHGFKENGQAKYAGEARSVDYTNLKIDSAGRIVIPAEMRAAMLAKPGDMLTARVVDGELRVVSRAWVMARIDEEARRFKMANPDASLAEDLISNRKEETRLDEERWDRLEHEAAELPDRPARRR